MAEKKNVATEERPGGGERLPRETGGAALGRGGRMLGQWKSTAVLQLLGGEDLKTVSRRLGVMAPTLSQWREAFLAAGEVVLSSKPESGAAAETVKVATTPAST